MLSMWVNVLSYFPPLHQQYVNTEREINLVGVSLLYIHHTSACGEIVYKQQHAGRRPYLPEGETAGRKQLSPETYFCRLLCEEVHLLQKKFSSCDYSLE